MTSTQNCLRCSRGFVMNFLVLTVTAPSDMVTPKRGSEGFCGTRHGRRGFLEPTLAEFLFRGPESQEVSTFE